MTDRIKKLSFTHEAFADYLLANPGCTLRELSVVFGYTPAWLCSVINSDMFQAYLAQRRVPLEQGVLASIDSKLKGIAYLAMERLEETLQKTDDADVIVDSFDKVMHRYGYAPNARNGAQGGTNIKDSNVFYLNAEQFRQVQGRLVESHAGALPAPEKPEGEKDPAEHREVSTA
jgi:hypothetical protein